MSQSYPLFKIFVLVLVSFLALVLFVVFLSKAKTYCATIRAQRDENNLGIPLTILPDRSEPPNNNVSSGFPSQANAEGNVKIFYFLFAFLLLLDHMRARNAGGDPEAPSSSEQGVPDHLHPAQPEAGLPTNVPSRHWRLLMPGSMLEILIATLGRRVFVVPTSWLGNFQGVPEPFV